MRHIECSAATWCGALAVVVAMLLTEGCGQATVSGHAMEPALRDGERVQVTTVISSLDRERFRKANTSCSATIAGIRQTLAIGAPCDAV